MYQWDGVKWTAVSAGAIPHITIGDSPPGAPNVGDLWWDSVGCQLYVWYNDGTSIQWAVTNSLMGGPYASAAYVDAGTPANNVGRNACHNALFRIQQRGGGPWTSGGYTADRWGNWGMAATGNTSSISIVSLTDTDRSQIGDEDAVYALQVVFTGGTTNDMGLVHLMEDLRRFSNKTITVSFWARATSGTPKIGNAWGQNFGSGGTPSGFVTGNGGVTPALSTIWQRYKATMAVPSTAGKVFGTSGGDTLEMDWYLSCPSTNADYAASGNLGQQSGTVQFWGMQIEIGSVMTPLVKRDPHDDYLLCSRFYKSTAFNLGGYGGSAGSNAYTGPSIMNAPPMRVAPTVTIVGTPSYSNSSALTFPSVSATQITPTITVGVAGNFWVACTLQISADL